MPVILHQLKSKREALRDKDCTALAAAHVHIPGLGSDYTAEELQAIFDFQIALLDRIEENADSETGLTAIRDELFSEELTLTDRALIQAVLNGEPVDAMEADNPWAIRLAFLYRFAVVDEREW